MDKLKIHDDIFKRQIALMTTKLHNYNYFEIEEAQGNLEESFYSKNNRFSVLTRANSADRQNEDSSFEWI